mgnify:CR=1 FL=1
MSISRGIVAAIIISFSAYSIDYFLRSNNYFSLGSSTIAFIMGAISAQFIVGLEKGAKWINTTILPVVVILLGFGLNINLFLDPKVGYRGLLIAVISAFSCLAFCYMYAIKTGLDKKSALAMGAGGSICGNSAVMAVSGPLKLDEKNIAVTLAIVNIMGFITFLLIPILANLLGLIQLNAGIWAGATIHAVPQAIAAGESIGKEGLVISTAVKLSRVSLLIFVVPLCAYIGNRTEQNEMEKINHFNIPLFVPGFIIAALISTLFFPESISEIITDIASFLLIPLLAAVGFFISKESFNQIGGRLLILGILSTSVMIMTSYSLIIIT